MTNWIDIVEYANKYKISQSTLRRRIRTQSIAFKMERGKYYIEDSIDAIATAPLFSRHKVIQSASVLNRSRNLTTNGSASPVKNTTTFVSKSNVFDPVDTFLKQEVLPTYLVEDYEKLKAENTQLKKLMAEQQTLIKTLEAELGLPNSD